MSVMAEVLYGRGRVGVRLPAGARVLRGAAHIPALADPAGAVRAALQRPIAARGVGEIAREKRPRTVAITISDITRPVPNELIVTALLEELAAAGVRDEQCVVIVGTGMHRPSMPEEKREMLGDALLRRVEVIDHNADDAASLVRVSEEPPVSVIGRFVRADMRVVTGLIEPHFMAGFSGGRKGICPALVDLRTVQRFHGYGIMADPNSVEGRLEGNPCHEESLRVARIVGCDFLVNVAITHDRRPAAVFAGDMEAAHLAGCRQVAEWNTAEIDRPFDLVVTSSGGYPLDKNFYQSVKGMVTALPALHAGSILVVLSACSEIGSPEYAETMRRFGGDPAGFLAEIARRSEVVKDQWQYQMHCRVLSRIGRERLMLAGDGLPANVLSGLAVTPVGGEGDVAARVQRFVDGYLARHPSTRVAVIPDGPYTMVRLAGLQTETR